MGLRIFVLTGAGVSAESGVATFRGPGGLWDQHDLMQLATPEGFARDPARVHAFYNGRRLGLAGVEPNPAHRALARLEAGLAARGGELFLCTQNVDDLHERAGSRAVLHMHGRITRVRCQRCDHVREERGEIGLQTVCVACGRAGGLRPDVVWFGEVPRGLDAIDRALADCDLFCAIGTSGEVYPAADFVRRAAIAGARTVELNLAPTWGGFDEHRSGPAGVTTPAWVDEILAEAPA